MHARLTDIRKAGAGQKALETSKLRTETSMLQSGSVGKVWGRCFVNSSRKTGFSWKLPRNFFHGTERNCLTVGVEISANPLQAAVMTFHHWIIFYGWHLPIWMAFAAVPSKVRAAND